MRILRNPYYLYVFTFGIIFVVYSLGWSDLYPQLSFKLLAFFFLSFILFIIGGVYIEKYTCRKYSFNIIEKKIGLKVLFIYILYAFEFIYNHGVPILLIFSNPDYKYNEFGIPTLHPIILTYSSFYTVFLFHCYLCNKSRDLRLYIFLLLLIPVLIFNRAMLILNICSMFLVYCHYGFELTKRKILSICIYVLIGLYLFGVAGNYRTVLSNNNSYFLTSMEATTEFRDSFIPKEFMWGYIYMSSPLATLQKTVNLDFEESSSNFSAFITYCILPDFVSKRIADYLGIKDRTKMAQLNEILNVGTFYEHPYRLLGWLGILMMCFYTFFFVLIYVALIQKSRYYVVGISILSVVICFCSFVNMFTFSGLSFQLVYPLLFALLKK